MVEKLLTKTRRSTKDGVMKVAGNFALLEDVSSEIAILPIAHHFLYSLRRAM